MFEEWHKSPEFQKRVLDFHNTCAIPPSGKDVDQAKKIIEKVKPMLSDQMKAQGLFENTRYEYRGSSYEGVKVAKSANDQDLEFDIMFVIKGGTDLKEHNLRANGYADLKLKAGKEPKQLFQKTMIDGCISAFYTRNKFYSHLDKCNFSELDLTDLGYKKGEITFKKSYHGPAVQIDVKHNGKKFFSIDLAPHFDLTGQGEMYVPKAPKKYPNYVGWFRSFSLDEKKKLDGIDRHNECRKMVLRCLKVFVKSRTELACLTSQHLKRALFLASDGLDANGQPSNLIRSWKLEDLGQRFMDVLKILEDALEKRFLPHFILPEVNLFENLNDAAMQNMKCRCCRLRRNSLVMPQLLSLVAKEKQNPV